MRQNWGVYIEFWSVPSPFSEWNNNKQKESTIFYYTFILEMTAEKSHTRQAKSKHLRTRTASLPCGLTAPPKGWTGPRRRLVPLQRHRVPPFRISELCFPSAKPEGVLQSDQGLGDLDLHPIPKFTPSSTTAPLPCYREVSLNFSVRWRIYYWLRQ